jgi:hypothetical protein
VPDKENELTEEDKSANTLQKKVLPGQVEVFIWDENTRVFIMKAMYYIDPDNPSWDLSRFLIKQRRNYVPYNSAGRQLNPKTCWVDVLEDGSCKLFLARPRDFTQKPIVDYVEESNGEQPYSQKRIC